MPSFTNDQFRKTVDDLAKHGLLYASYTSLPLSLDEKARSFNPSLCINVSMCPWIGLDDIASARPQQ